MRNILLIASVIVAAATGAWAADVKAGKAAYDTSCKSCHGPDGTPNVQIAKMMKVDMKDLKSKEIQSMSDADLVKIMTMGKGKMAAPKAVTAKSAEDIAAYVKTLK